MNCLAAARNLLKVWLFLGAICARCSDCSVGSPAATGCSRRSFCTLFAAVAAYWYADRVVMGMVEAKEPARRGATRALDACAPRGEGEGRQAELYVMRDGHPRSLAAGRGPRGSAIAVSRGLLAAAPPAELEAVLAHELAHVRRRDVVTQEAAVWIASALVELTRIGGFLQRALMFVIGPGLAAALVHLCFRRGVSSQPIGSRLSCAGRRTGRPTRCFGSSRRTS